MQLLDANFYFIFSKALSPPPPHGPLGLNERVLNFRYKPLLGIAPLLTPALRGTARSAWRAAKAMSGERLKHSQPCSHKSPTDVSPGVPTGVFWLLRVTHAASEGLQQPGLSVG